MTFWTEPFGFNRIVSLPILHDLSRIFWIQFFLDWLWKWIWHKGGFVCIQCLDVELFLNLPKCLCMFFWIQLSLWWSRTAATNESTETKKPRHKRYKNNSKTELKSKSVVCVHNELTKVVEIKRNILSPLLFNLYSEEIFVKALQHIAWKYE